MGPLATKAVGLILTALGSMAAQLLSERFLKAIAVRILTWIAIRTKTDKDDKLLQDVKAAWDVP